MKRQGRSRITSITADVIILIFFLFISVDVSLVQAATNPYPTTQDWDNDGYYEVPCTRFAWQQVYDNLGVALPAWGNAGTWYASAQNAGIAVGNIAKPGSVAVWSGGGAGHVAYVTSANGNTFTVNEGGRTDLDHTSSHGVACGYQLTNAVGGARPGDTGKILLGFIYPKNSDITPPKITDPKITNVTKDGYTVTCTVSDNIGVTYVSFPSWNSDIHKGEDANWLLGTLSGNTASVRVNLSELKSGAIEGNYMTHIYANDAAGNHSVAHVSVFIDRTAPVITDVSVSYLDCNGYTVRCKVEDNGKIDRVQFPTWTLEKGQDDLMSDWGTKITASGSYNENDGYYYFTVCARDHNNESGKYMTHIYAYDTCGNLVCYDGEVTAKIEVPDLSLQFERNFYEYHSKDINSFYCFISGGSEQIELSSVRMVTTATVNGKNVSVEKDFGERIIEADPNKVVSFVLLIDNKELEGAQGCLKTSVYAVDGEGNESVCFICYDTSRFQDTIYTTMNIGETAEVQMDSAHFQSLHYMNEINGDIITAIKTDEGNDSGFFTALHSGRAYIAGYNLLTGESIFQVVDVEDPLASILKESSNYEISQEGYLSGVELEKNTVQEVCSNFTNDSLVCRDASGNVLSDTDLLGTGSTISIMDADGETVKAQCEVVIAGDILGDGKINGKDVSMLARYCLQKETLTDAQLAAGDVYGDGKINGKDVSMLARYCLGKETIGSGGN